MQSKVKVRLVVSVLAALMLAALFLSVYGSASIPTEGSRDHVRMATTPTAASQNKAKMVEGYGKLPLHFEVNTGQADQQVKFLSRGRGYSLFLTANQAVLSLNSPQSTPRAQRQHSKNSSASSAPSAVRIKLVGANPQPQVSGQEELPGKVNYFIGSDPKRWRTNVPTYAKVKYEQVYPGVDLVYYGNQGQLEYDFLVAPGADPKAITLGFEGADKVEVDAQGDLVLRTAGGEIRQHKPLMYQEVDGERREIPGGYTLVERRAKSVEGDHFTLHSPHSTLYVAFQVGDYDKSQPLIIDPVLVYSTYLGGADIDYGYLLAVDAAGNAYVTGQTFSSNFPKANPFDATRSGASDAFVTKIDPFANQLIYSTYLGGSSEDWGTSIAVDAAGNAYVAGGTSSSNFPVKNPYQSKRRGSSDAFVTKLNASGSALLYSTYLGGSSDDNSYGMAVAAGGAYVTGWTNSFNFPTKNPAQPTKQGPWDAFVTKIDTTKSGSASLVYSTYLGGTGGDSGSKIAVDAAGNASVIGGTTSSDFPTVNAVQPTFGGGANDSFVTKIDTTKSGLASLVYSTYLGGSGIDGDPSWASGITVGAGGNVYVTGRTASSDFPITVNAAQSTLGGAEDAYVTKLDTTQSGLASLVYSTYLGGSGDDRGVAIAVDAAGNAYVIGATHSADFPTANPLDAVLSGADDVFVAKLDASGSALVFSTYLGGSGSDRGRGIALGPMDSLYIAGFTSSTDFPTVNPFQGSYGGGDWDAFVAIIM
jgi:hypothetical protein